MKYFLYLFSLIILSASNSLANNNDFNSDSSIEIVVTPAYNPEFGEMLEGTYNYIFLDPTWLTDKDKNDKIYITSLIKIIIESIITKNPNPFFS